MCFVEVRTNEGEPKCNVPKFTTSTQQTIPILWGATSAPVSVNKGATSKYLTDSLSPRELECKGGDFISPPYSLFFFLSNFLHVIQQYIFSVRTSVTITSRIFVLQKVHIFTAFSMTLASKVVQEVQECTLELQ